MIRLRHEHVSFLDFRHMTLYPLLYGVWPVEDNISLQKMVIPHKIYSFCCTNLMYYFSVTD